MIPQKKLANLVLYYYFLFKYAQLCSAVHPAQNDLQQFLNAKEQQRREELDAVKLKQKSQVVFLKTILNFFDLISDLS